MLLLDGQMEMELGRTGVFGSGWFIYSTGWEEASYVCRLRAFVRF